MAFRLARPPARERLIKIAHAAPGSSERPARDEPS